MAVYDEKVLNGEHLSYLVGLIKAADATKQDTLVFNTAYNATSNKAATMADVPDELADLTADSTHRTVTDTEKSTWSGKQDALVFNSTYDASSNKVATMSDVPDDLADLNADATHRLVTDTEKATWNGKADVSDIPTNNNQLTNGAGYQTASDVQTAIAQAGHMSNAEVVQALPAVADATPNKIYLVLKASSSSGNVYDEWMVINNAWEHLGDTALDIEALSNTEIQTIWDATT